jgi:colicin import membrane protein
MQGRDELKRELRRFYTWLGLAAAAHVALIAAVVALQLLYVRMHPPLKIVNVSLVEMPGLPGPAGGPKNIEAAPAKEMPPEKAEPAPQPEKKIPDPTAVKKIPEKSPVKPPEPAPKKESAADEQKRLQAAMEQLRKKKIPEPAPKKESAADEQKHLQATLDQFRKKTAAQQPPANTAKGPSNLSTTPANFQKKVVTQGAGTAYSGTGSGAGGGLYGAGGKAFDPYKAKIAGIIQGNWEFSSRMVRSGTGMEVYVSLLIMPDGSVSQIRYDRKSSSEYLNTSVRNALSKSLPFPSLPREFGSRGIWVGFVFTPEGIGR